ncbi:hypothetical protein KKF05_00695 [Patescibacteria group bacterium]|nr:hypothetical protein [Patescibacteria group bacterium]MBU1028751.1 hypothetical protein [Patescibacteria group bacterium]MBU1916104.1 hypothetical protein [Patescibacteria group bacterium]
MVETGCGFGGCTYKCSIPYADYGQECISSADCEGRCYMFTGFQLPSWNDEIKEQCESFERGPNDLRLDYRCSGEMRGQCAQFEKLSNCYYGIELLEENVLRWQSHCEL